MHWIQRSPIDQKEFFWFPQSIGTCIDTVNSWIQLFWLRCCLLHPVSYCFNGVIWFSFIKYFLIKNLLKDACPKFKFLTLLVQSWSMVRILKKLIRHSLPICDHGKYAAVKCLDAVRRLIDENSCPVDDAISTIRLGFAAFFTCDCKFTSLSTNLQKEIIASFNSGGPVLLSWLDMCKILNILKL